MTGLKAFRLTPGLIAAHAGSNVVCLAQSATGQTFRLYDERPGAQLNTRLGGTVVDPNGEVEGDGDEDTGGIPAGLTRVDVSGVLEQRAGYHSECGGWSDGHDAVAERMIAALEEGNVLLVMDSPGGAHAGLEQAIARVVQEKNEHGRKVIGWIDEQCGSAMYWWAACVCDEIYAPPAGVAGSIGARAAHGSEAGALAAAGVEITFFCWPNEGKIAFAPELPLSDLGKQRGMRDTSIAGEAFAAAVGPCRGLSREEIVELSADALSGDLALNAKLIDGIASYEDVLSYAIALAETSGDLEMTQAAVQNPSVAVRSAAPVLRAEGDEPKDPPKDPPDAPEPKEGMEPDHICKNCGMQQKPEAKYCNQCGDSMEAAPLEDPDGDGDAKAKASGDEPKPAAAFPDKKETQGSTLATLLGLRKGASDLAVKTALVRKLQVTDYVAALTGTTDEGAQLGQLRAMSEDAAASGKLRRDVSEMRTRADSTERLDLLKKLAASNLPDYPRGNLLVDDVAENGRVTATKPAPAYAEMKLSTLRGLVNAKISNAAPAAERSPFVAQPDPAIAAQSAHAYAVEEAKKHPVVQKAARDGIDITTAAETYVRNFGAK